MSARCLLGCWFVFSLLITAIYTANLAAVLTISAPVKPIDSLKDLSKQPEVDVILPYGTSIWTLFETSTDPVYKKIFQRVVKATTLEDVLQRVRTGQACFIDDTQYLKYIVILNCHTVRLATEVFQHHYFALPFPKRSSVKGAIDNSLQIMMESGIINHMTDKWLKRPTYCSVHPSQTDTTYRLDLDRLGGVFLLFLVFLTLAVIYFIVQQFVLNVMRNLRDKRPI